MCPVEPSCSLLADEQADMTKPGVAFRNFLNAHAPTPPPVHMTVRNH